MFAVEMLPAGHGDALVVEYGDRVAPHQLLIDAGPFHSWEGVRTELLRRRKDRYEVFVVTHIDEDHIGGAISLLDDPDLKHRVDHVWFNGYVHCKSGGNVLGPVLGEQLTKRIAEDGFTGTRGSLHAHLRSWVDRSSCRTPARFPRCHCPAARAPSSCRPTGPSSRHSRRSGPR